MRESQLPNYRIVTHGQKLDLDGDVNYFITSDLHFFHKNILKHAPKTRLFENVEEMNAAIVKHWNETVGVDDVIFFLGDFSFGSLEETLEILNDLNGNIVFIRGNHDRMFDSINIDEHYYLEVKVDKKLVCMMHYPLTAWNKQHYGSVQLFGHCHGKYQGVGRQVDVGYDNFGKIMKLKDVLDIALSKKVVTVDGH